MALEELGLAVGIEGFRQFMRQMGQMDDGIENQGKSWINLGSLAGGAAGILTGVVKTGLAVVATGAAAAIGAVVGLGAAITKLTLDAAEVESARRTFDTLWQSVGEDGPTAIEKLRDATRGMVADAELMNASNKFVSMGLANTTDEAAQLAEIATQLGVAMGEDATASMENFALLLANQSIPRLDSFGISSGRVRERIAELQAETAGLSREQAFMQAVMEEAAITMERVGEQGGDVGSQIGRLQVWFDNLKLTIGQAFLPVLEAVIPLITELAMNMGDRLMPIVDTVSFALQFFANSMKNGVDIATSLMGAIAQLIFGFGGTSEQVQAVGEKFWEAYDGIIALKDSILEAVRDAIPVFQAVIGNVWDFIKTKLVPVIQDQLIPLLKDKIGESMTTAKGFWENTLKPAFEGIMEALETLFAWWQENGPQILEIALEVFGKIREAKMDLIERVIPFLVETLQKLADWWVENGPEIMETAGLVAEWIAKIADGAVEMWTFVKPILGLLVDTILKVVEIVMDIIQGDWQDAWDTAKQIVSDIVESFPDIFDKFAEWVLNTFLGTTLAEVRAQWQKNFEMFVEIITAIIDLIKFHFANFADGLKVIGRNLIEGLVAGINEKTQFVADAIRGVIQGAINTAKAALGIQSPSTVFFGIAADTIEGYRRGIEALAPQLQSTLQAAIQPTGLNQQPAPVVNTITNVTNQNFNLTTNSSIRPGGLQMEFDAMSMRSR